jgi:hypothetical protein
LHLPETSAPLEKKMNPAKSLDASRSKVAYSSYKDYKVLTQIHFPTNKLKVKPNLR